MFLIHGQAVIDGQKVDLRLIGFREELPSFDSELRRFLRWHACREDIDILYWHYQDEE
jgi:hypothetical protein